MYFNKLYQFLLNIINLNFDLIMDDLINKWRKTVDNHNQKL